MRSDARIAIVGGSLVGPAAELMLRQAGFENVTTYEASRIVMPTSGGVMGLRPEVLFELAQLGLDTRALVALTSSDVISSDVVNGEIRRRGRSTFPGKVTYWDVLYQQLAERTAVQHGKRVVGLEPTSGGALLSFKDGDEVEVDLAVFADGRTSTGRRLLDPERQLTYQGYMVWRGLVEPVMEAEGFHRHYDQRNATLFSITEPIIQSGLQYWEFSHNLPGVTYEEMTGLAPERRAFILPHQVTERATDVLTDAMARYQLPATLRAPIEEATTVMGIPVNDLPMATRAYWRVGGGHAVLLGDAIVPVRLQVGVGLNSGLKQAKSLAATLAAGHSLSTWERLTLNRLAAWVELGRSRAHRNNLGTYVPVRPGRTAVPRTNVWSTPEWTMA